MANFGLGFAFGAIDDGITKMQDKVSQGFESLGGTVKSIGQQAAAASATMGAMVSAGVTKSVNVASRAYTGLSSAVGAVDRSLSAAIGQVKGFGAGLRDNVVSGAKAAVTSIRDVSDSLRVGMATGANAALESLDRMTLGIKTFAAKGWGKFNLGAKAAWMWTKQKIPQAWMKLKAMFQKDGEQIGDAGKDAEEGWGGFFESIKNGAITVQTITTRFTDFLRSLKDSQLLQQFSDKLEGLKDHITGLPDALKAGGQLTSGLEAEMTSMTKSAKAMGVQMGYTGKELKKFTAQAVGMGYGLNIGEDAAGKAISAFESHGEALRALGLDSAASVAKLSESMGVDAALLGDIGAKLTKEVGLNAQELDAFVDAYVVMGQKTKDVPGAMEAMREAAAQMTSKKAMGQSSQQVLAFGKDIAALSVAFKSTGMNAEEARTAAMEMGNTLVESQREWSNAFAGTSDTGLSQLMKSFAVVGADADMMMQTMSQGPMQFAESIQSLVQQQGGWEKVTKEQMNFIRGQLSEGMGGPEAAEKFLLFMQNTDAATLKMVKDVREANVNLKQLGEEGFSTGLTLQDSFQRAEDAFIDRFRRISKKEARAFVSDTSAEFKKFNDVLSKTASGGGPMGMFVKKMAEAHHLGSMAFIPQTLRPMITIFGTMVGQMGPVLTGLGALGLRFKHLVNPITLVTGAVVGLGVAFMASEKDFKGQIDAVAGSDKAYKAAAKEVGGLEEQLAKMRAEGKENTEEFKDLDKALGRKKERLEFADTLKSQNQTLGESSKKLKDLEAKRAKLLKQGKDVTQVEEEIFSVQVERLAAEEGIAKTRQRIGEEARNDSKERIRDTINEGIAVVKGIVAAAPVVFKEVMTFVRTEALPMVQELWKEIAPGVDWVLGQLKTLPVEKYARQAGDFIGTVFQSGINLLGTINWGPILGGALEGATSAISKIGEVARVWIAKGFEMLKDVDWKGVLATSLGTLDRVGVAVFGFVQTALMGGIDLLRNVDWTGAFLGLAGALGSGIKGIFTGMFTEQAKDPNTVSVIGDTIGGLLKGGIGLIGDVLKGLGMAAGQLIWDGIISLKDTLFTGGGGLFTAEFWTGMWQGAASAVTTVFTFDFWKGLWNGAVDAITSVDWGSVAAIAGGLLIAGLGMAFFGPFKAKITSVFQGIKDTIGGIFGTKQTEAQKAVQDGVDRPLQTAADHFKKALLDGAQDFGRAVENALEGAYQRSEATLRGVATRACGACQCGGDGGGMGSGGGLGGGPGGQDNDRRRRKGGKVPKGGFGTSGIDPNYKGAKPPPPKHKREDFDGDTTPDRDRTPAAPTPDRTPDRDKTPTSPTPDRTPDRTPPQTPDRPPPAAAPDRTRATPTPPSMDLDTSPSPSGGGSLVDTKAGRIAGGAGLAMGVAGMFGMDPTSLLMGGGMFGQQTATGRVADIAVEEATEQGMEKGIEKGAQKAAERSVAKTAANTALGGADNAAAAAASGSGKLATILGKGAKIIPALGMGLVALDAGLKAYEGISNLENMKAPTEQKVGAGAAIAATSLADAILFGLPSALDPKIIEKAGVGGAAITDMLTSVDGFNRQMDNAADFFAGKDVIAEDKAKTEAKAWAQTMGTASALMGGGTEQEKLANYADIKPLIDMAHQVSLAPATVETQPLIDAMMAQAKEKGLSKDETNALLKAAASPAFAVELGKHLDSLAQESVAKTLEANPDMTPAAAQKFREEALMVPEEDRGVGPSDGSVYAPPGGLPNPYGAGAAPQAPWKYEAPMEAAYDPFASIDWEKSAEVEKRLSGLSGKFEKSIADLEAAQLDLLISGGTGTEFQAQIDSLRQLQMAAETADQTIVALTPMWDTSLQSLSAAWGMVAGNIQTVDSTMSSAISPEKAAAFNNFFTSLWSGASGFFGDLQGTVDEMFGNSISTDVMEDFQVSNDAVVEFLTSFSTQLESTVQTAFVGGFTKAFADTNAAAQVFVNDQTMLYDQFGLAVVDKFRGMWTSILDMTGLATQVMQEDVAAAMLTLDQLRADMDRASAMLTTAQSAQAATIAAVDPSIVQGSQEHLIHSVNYPDWFMKLYQPQVAKMNQHLAQLVSQMQRLVSGGAASGAKASAGGKPSEARSKLSGMGVGSGAPRLTGG